jgi:hypothetical protein
MTRHLLRTTILAITIIALTAIAATAQAIPKGVDYWRTPASGTMFKFPDGDVENLCHKKPDPSWNHQVTLRGIPAQGSDWDSEVARLDDVKLSPSASGVTRVQFKSLSLISTEASTTPCGRLIWTARLSRRGPQPITKMKITMSSKGGGVFAADLALRVEIQANNADTGVYVGSLPYDIKLPDPAGGTPWSFGSSHEFRAGMTEHNDCLKVLRDKISTFPPGSQHIYFISNLIAKGDCREQK